MQFNDPLPPPVSMFSAPVTVVDRQGLRAALRLVLRAGDADEAAAKLPEDGDLIDLGLVARDAVSRARTERWLARLPWRQVERDGRLLGPASGVGAEAAIALALGAGLRLDGRDLAEVLDARVERVGEWLVEGRRALDPEMPDPCRKTAWLVGRYEDRSLDPDERVELLTHLNRCQTCQQVVERSREVDARIASEFARLRADVPPAQLARVSPIERVRRSALLAGAALFAIVALVAGGTIVSRLLAGPDEPVPLVSAREPSPHSGWLVMAAGDGSVQARHLATGETRRIFDTDDPISGVSAQVMLSPAGTRLMTFYGEYSQSARSRVVVNALDGTEVGRVEWASENIIHYPTGWIDERRIMVRVFPVYFQGQPGDEFAEQYATESGLLIVDVETGAQREVLMGNVAFGIPAPGGRYVAVAKVTDPQALTAGTNLYTLEIWEINADGSASGPVVTVPDWTATGGGMVWSGDGSRVFVTQATGETPPDTGDEQQRQVRNIIPHRLIAIGLDGSVATLADAGVESVISPVSAAYDGSAVVYVRGDTGNVVRSTSYWKVAIGDGEPQPLSDAISAAYGRAGVVWSPDGATLLMSEVTVPYLEPDAENWTRWGPTATDVVAIGPDDQRTVLLTTYSVGERLLGWLPDEALPEPATDTGQIAYSAPEPVVGVPDETRLDAGSAASRDGIYVTLDDLSIGSPLVWETIGNDTQRLRGSIDDAIWLPGTRGLLSVSGGREQSRSSSRLSVLASTNPYAPLALEPLQFDPARINGDRSRRYAAPHVSPDGLNTSFFVVDDTGGIELWVANATTGIDRVTSWRLPGDRIIEPPLEATWADDRTLVFVEPRDWTGGMPETAAIRRVIVAEDGSATVADVIEWVGRGDDKGVAIMELAISSDSGEIAWRTRHFTEWSASDGRFDTIHLAPTDDLSRDVELTRGSPGSGLTWSADGQRLLVGIDRDVLLANPNDLRIEVISSGLVSEYPIWVGDDEVWFGVDAGQVMRVRVE